VFIGIEEGIDGLVHISDFSWTKRVNHPSEVYKKGDVIKAVVLSVDMENERCSLSIKQLEKDPWAEVASKYAVGTQLEVKVTKAADFGVFVELEPEIEGLIHISELSTERVEKTEDVAKPGDIIRAEVISIDREARKIGLSAKQITVKGDRAEVQKYSKAGSSKTSLGDLFGDQFKPGKTEE
jgi:small subunit ribosomal protein S1